jgi:DNA cross-link repair 1A protein
VLINLSSSAADQPILIEDDQETDIPSLGPQKAKDEAKPDAVESGITCPVCSKLLDCCQGNLSLAERHINLCLDQPGPSDPTGPHSPTTVVQEQADLPDSIDLEEAEDEEDEGSVKSLLSETRSDQAPGKPRAAKTKTRVTKQSGRKSAVEKAGGLRKGGAGKKPVPFYKLMPGTTISVDCFSHGAVPGVSAYFLSHAHSDHYTKLSSSWKHGKIYCSKTTANLLKLKLRVDSHWIVPLDFNTPYTVDDVRVVLIDANQFVSLLLLLDLNLILTFFVCFSLGSCPGSAMFLFEGITKPDRKPFRYLHCGDFRATPTQLRHPAIHEKVIDICYLDTTYLGES